ncbi:cytochrome p450 [Lentinula edodes]|uniref:Cytochrome p450 n=1 Tax=Lentinula edodes TaxID=5353 RepID=A0A1Q3E073_LENED|nr:cytochrome p450 [Lentinula edodes]
MHKVHGVALIRVRRTTLSSLAELFSLSSRDSEVSNTCAIPHPPGYPFPGNILSLDVPTHGYHGLAQKYASIYQLNLLGRKVIFVSSYTLVNELSDDSRFQKSVGGALKETRNLIHDGIFTAFDGESSWITAHRLLIPVFGTYFTCNACAGYARGHEGNMRPDDMQMGWPGMPTESIIDPNDDLTRVALDTIALCSMSYRLDSFASPPFVQTMVDFLREYGKHQPDVEKMSKIAHSISQRARMSDNSIIDNLLTFLIAALTSEFGFLAEVPALGTMSILGDQPAQLGDLTRMEYLHAVIRESKRLQPTAAIRAVYPLKNTVIGDGKYFIVKDTPIALQIWDLHRDVSVLGLDNSNPSGCLRETLNRCRPMHGNLYEISFGFGMRSCIGRAFAWQEVRISYQEMCIVLSSIVQRFDLALANPLYELQITQAITIKPKGFRGGVRIGGTANFQFSQPPFVNLRYCLIPCRKYRRKCFSSSSG